MTFTTKKEKVKRCALAVLSGKTALAAMSVASLFLILLFPSLAIDYMNRGMKLCVSTVIPSLFPFMVASELIVMTGAARPLGRLLRAPARFFFGISGEGASALLLGTVCGFPVGTRAAVSMYRRGTITHAELSRLVCFSNNPSSAFVISAVGTTLFGSREFGSALYFTTILSSLIVGVMQNIILGKSDTCGAEVSFDEGEKKGIGDFSAAVSSSAQALLCVCAFVVFFSTLTGTLGVFLAGLGASEIISAIFFSFFELTSGASAAAGVEPLLLAVVVAAFAVGWSGLSVHLQMIGICDGIGVPMLRYFLAKLSQGLINAALVFGYLSFFGDTLTFDVQSVGVFENFDVRMHWLSLLVSALFFSCMIFAAFLKIKKRII